MPVVVRPTPDKNAIDVPVNLRCTPFQAVHVIIVCKSPVANPLSTNGMMLLYLRSLPHMDGHLVPVFVAFRPASNFENVDLRPRLRLNPLPDRRQRKWDTPKCGLVRMRVASGMQRGAIL